MSVIIRYILRELVVTFLIGFAALTCLLLPVGLVQVAKDRHIPLVYIGQLIPFIFAKMSSISLPVTLLLATTIFFARMSGNNEVIALKALGIPPKAFLVPVFAIAAIISIIGVGINELAVTWGQKGINAVIYRSADYMLIGQLKQTHRFEMKNNQITISVRGVDEQRRLIKPTIILKNEAAMIEAESAQITIDYNTNFLVVTFVDMKAVGDVISYIAPNRTLKFPLSEIVPTGESNRPADWSLYRIGEEKKKTVEQIEQQRRIIAAHRTFGASMGLVDDWAAPQIADAQKKIRSLQKHQNRLLVEPPRRWATGFCCFFFVWLGAPLAIWMKKTDFFSSFFACFVPILILYYPLLTFGLSQAKSGSLPPICVWLANAGIGFVGLWFLRQIHRY